MSSFYRIAIFIAIAFLNNLQAARSQQIEEPQKNMQFTGALGATSNGLSIIPTFSLNAPAFNFLMSVKKDRFSFDPDIRLTFDGKKGGMIFWFRYRPIQSKKFNLQLGAHPAYNFALRDIITSSTSSTMSTVTQARRFIAAEIFPSYKISDKVRVGFYYLNGFGMQKDGPMNTKFIAVNANVAPIPIFKNHFLQYTPQFYYLNIDGISGTYYTHTLGISGKNHPFLVQSTVNREIKTKIPGSKLFAWNISIFYTFNKKIVNN